MLRFSLQTGDVCQHHVQRLRVQLERCAVIRAAEHQRQRVRAANPATPQPVGNGVAGCPDPDISS